MHWWNPFVVILLKSMCTGLHTITADLPAKWILLSVRMSQKLSRQSGGQTHVRPVRSLWAGAEGEGSQLTPPCRMRYRQDGGFFLLMTQPWTVGVGKEPPNFFWEHGAGWGRAGRLDETKINSTTKASVSSAPGFFFNLKSHLSKAQRQPLFSTAVTSS